MSKQERIERAVIDLGGEWPSAGGEMFLLQCKDSICAYVVGDYSAGRSPMPDKQHWDIICNQAEFVETSARLDREGRLRQSPKTAEWDGEGMPPVGIWVYLSVEDEHVEVICHGKGTKFCGRDKEGYIGIFDADLAQPIQSHRDKVIEMADRIIEDATDDAVDRAHLGILYKAGMLKLPEGES